MSHCEDLWVSINLSTLQLPSPRNLAAIETILRDPAAQADKVVLEVTETALASSIDGGITALNRLKGFGVRIAIDDFGTGYSSLSALAELPADILKIDRSFLSGNAADAPSAAMLEGILGLAYKLNLEAIAEGIEDPAQLALVRGLGCRLGQGYLLVPPRPRSADRGPPRRRCPPPAPGRSGRARTPEPARGPDFLLHSGSAAGVLPQGVLEHRQQRGRGLLNHGLVLGVLSQVLLDVRAHRNDLQAGGDRLVECVRREPAGQPLAAVLLVDDRVVENPVGSPSST